MERLEVYALYNKDDEIKYVGTITEIMKMSGMDRSTVNRWVNNKKKKFKSYLVGYSDDELE